MRYSASRSGTLITEFVRGKGSVRARVVTEPRGKILPRAQDDAPLQAQGRGDALASYVE